MIRQFPLLLQVEEWLESELESGYTDWEDQQTVLALGAAYAVLGRVDEIANRPFPESPRGISPFLSGLWAALVHAKPLPSGPVPMEEPIQGLPERFGLLAAGTLAALPMHERGPLRERIMMLCPPAMTAGDYGLLEALHWSTGTADESDFPALAARWAESLFVRPAATALLAWGLSFAQSRGQDFATLTRSALQSIDDDLFGDDDGDGARVAAREERPSVSRGRMTFPVVLSGEGTLAAALPVAVPCVTSVGTYLDRLLAGMFRTKTKVSGVRSTSDLRRRLFGKSFRIEVDLHLEGGLRLAEEDLLPLRKRMELSMRWLRMHHPELEATARLAVVDPTA